MSEGLNERGKAMEKMWKSLMSIESELGMGCEVLEWMLLELNPDSEKWWLAFRNACMEWDV